VVYGLRQDSVGVGDFTGVAVESSLVVDVANRYPDYRKEVNRRTSAFFAQTFLWQGLCGVLALTTLSRWLLLKVGVYRAIQLMPIFALVALVFFGNPLDLITIQILLVVGGVMNYSLNNATKEVLYTVTETEEKYKIKPVIEGPMMRLADTAAALVNLLCGSLAGLLAIAPENRDRLFLAFCFLCVLAWWHQVRYAGREYESLRAQSP
jgi:ATP/ADP translocase